MGGSSPSSLIFLVAAAAMFYLLIIRPQQKRTKAQAEMLTALEPGVEIVTIGGIFGTIVEVGDERLRIRVADGSEFEIARRAIGSVVPVSDEAEPAEEESADDADDALPEAPEVPAVDESGGEAKH